MNDGKIILSGKIELLSPIHIGSGESDSTDLDVITDSYGNPFITFTSFIGALKHHLAEDYDVDKGKIEKLFGFANDQKVQGSIISGSDLLLSSESNGIIRTRDGIKIDLSTGMVEDGAKYDYQVVDSGARFDFKLEASYSSKSISRETILQYYFTIIKMLEDNQLDCMYAGLRIGAKANNGLGKINLTESKLYDYDFSINSDVIAWLKNTNDGKVAITPSKPLERKNNSLVIDAYFDLKTSLIQRSYNDNPSMPDSSHIQSGGKYILTGSGAKGAIIARAKKIANTIWSIESENKKDEFLITLFGFVDNENEGKKAIKAKLQIEERELPGYIAELQTRIKIDRFTGGTITSALFDSMPLFNTKELGSETDINKKCTRITLRVKDCSEAEAGLMLLVLKDLWTGDLPIGGEKGIGRGVFNGVFATIKFHRESYEINSKLEEKSGLQKYVDAFIKIAGGNKNE